MDDEDQQTVFENGRSWAIDERHKEQRSLRIAWLIALLSLTMAILLVVTLIVLLPLRRDEPIALLVDKTTGFVQRVDPSEGTPIRADNALLQSILAQYVVAYEAFDRAAIRSDYRKAALWSSGPARSAYLTRITASNPESPLNRYRPGDSVTVEVKSVSMIEPGAAFVRFDTFLTTPNARKEPLGSWISLVKFRFSDSPMSFEDRLLNPLGLQVFQYRRDPERPESAGAQSTVVHQNTTVLVPANPRDLSGRKQPMGELSE